LLIALVLALAAAPAMAIVPQLYFGLNLQVNAPTEDFSASDITHVQGGAETGFGGEFDVGITGSRGSVYAGYRIGKHDASAAGTFQGDHVTTSGEWEIQRAVIGGRLNLSGSLPTPVAPTLGAGITIGKTKATGSLTGSSAYLGASESSKSSVGWFVEGGVLIRPPGNLSVIGDIQYHVFDAKFETGAGDATLKVSFVTVQVGVRMAL